jgi:hypothetical protein
MNAMRPYAGYLHTELTALGFADLGCDPEELGGYDALLTRVYRGFGFEVEMDEGYGKVTLRVFGPGEAAGEAVYKDGSFADTAFPVEMPQVIVMGAIAAAVNLGKEQDRQHAEYTTRRVAFA